MNSKSKYLIKKTPTGIKFDLFAENSQMILNSEVYTTKQACKNGIESVKQNSKIANFEDKTTNSDEKVNNPKFELFIDKQDKFRFRLKAKNGEIIGTSQAYTTKQACKNGIESVKNNAESKIEEEA